MVTGTQETVTSLKANGLSQSTGLDPRHESKFIVSGQ